MDVLSIDQQVMKAVNEVPKEKLQFLIAFARFLSMPDTNVEMKPEATRTVNSKISILGRAKKCVKIADDFDKTPECFKEYV